ncbi:MAG: ShET2/EspL2 family type secretion system effector toxin [Solimicrobium sp.]|jgi:hypothetical protein|nr:ShET2/EspL2 family type secretion system effector toxin [Solimicrobium sp.]
MDLGSLSSRVHSQNEIAQTQIPPFPHESVMAQLTSMRNRWNYSASEREALEKCFCKMWSTTEAKNNPDDFARKQLSLLKDMDKYEDLRIACFDITTPSGCSEQMFFMYLELQEKVLEIIRNNLTDCTSLKHPREQHEINSNKMAQEPFDVLQNRLRTELYWQGRIFNRNKPSFEELVPNYKSLPYISVSSVPLRNLNGKVSIMSENPRDPTIRQLVCRHFATQFIKDIAQDKSGEGKVDLALYSSEESIAQHITMEIETSYQTLKNTGNRYELISNDQLGQHLYSCFEEMRKPGKQETLKVLLLEATDHSMVVRLRIKGANEKPTYVITFYDTNKTNMTVRCVTKELGIFKNYSLSQFINGGNSKKTGFYEKYYHGMEPISLLIDCNLLSFTENIVKKTKVLENFCPSELTSTQIHFLLAENFARDLAGLQRQLQTIGKHSPEKLFNLLIAKGENKVPGITIALQCGHADVVKIYGQLIRLLPETYYEELIDLFAATHVGGTPGLYMALENGHSDVIKVYGELLQLLPVDKCDRLIDLLAAKNAMGTPGLYIALQNGHAKAIEAYGELLGLIPKAASGKFIALLIATSNGNPALCAGMDQGNADAIRAYGNLCQLIPETEPQTLVGMLIAKSVEGVPSLVFALQNGHADAIRAYGELLQLVPVNKRGLLVDLLAAKNPGGPSGLYLAFEYGNADTVEAYCELLNLLNENELRQLFDLLEIVEGDSTSLVYADLNDTHKKTRELHQKVLQLISMWRAQLTTPRIATSDSNFVNHAPY